MHQRRNAVFPRQADQLLIVQLDQLSLRGEAVGEHGQIGHIGQRLPQHRPVHEGIHIPVGGQDTLFFLLIVDDDGLAGIDGHVPAQAVIVAQQLVERDPLPRGDARQGLPGLHRNHPPGV